MYNYIDENSLIDFHDYIIEQFGGLRGIKNEGQLNSILTHIQNDKYYPIFADKITHLFFGLVQFHVFNDGNKRTSILAVELFLYINNFILKI
ncbi:MAG: type II toxin-antitoxin system death-on-curing family toxin [Candidatus Gracilibacteria bacterium]|nr:type II toxin-antitoxin system death-on-curing family toxin [Candidatus Gracilibacteria bacterium]